MAKGKFRNPVRIKLSDLNVPHGKTSFVVQIQAIGDYGLHEGTIPIAYFGYIDGGIFIVTSYSYSVQGIKYKSTQYAYNFDPQNTAMIGLATATGVLFKELK